ncbi:unnamed protein product [Periconia digitata]|uniref:Uncharacterized protein n=1 Tax=Periconia digitata TaxID=1303443 RepID=A0A9W4UGY8_9PLEO|nr:unnamed protein product [Periconia digitata]
MPTTRAPSLWVETSSNSISTACVHPRPQQQTKFTCLEPLDLHPASRVPASALYGLFCVMDVPYCYYNSPYSTTPPARCLASPPSPPTTEIKPNINRPVKSLHRSLRHDEFSSRLWCNTQE